jgi:hypothetical protein
MPPDANVDASVVDASGQRHVVATARFVSPMVSAALDLESLDANRHGRLSPSQRRLIRNEMMGWLVNGMFVGGIGLSVASAFPSPVLKLLGWIAAGGTAIYMASKGYDCARDSAIGRIAAVTDHFAMHPVETGSTDGMRVLITMRGRRFWVPTRARDILAAPSITVYFTPRARVVINVESTIPG